MKKLLVGLLALGSISSYASLELNGILDSKLFDNEINDNISYYETLKSMFEGGSLPQGKKLSNVLWSGRCFNRLTPYKPNNKAYIFRVKRSASVGPIGNGRLTYEAKSVWNPKGKPNFFDKLSLIDALMSSRKLKFNPVSILKKSQSIHYAGTRSYLRFSGNYLVEKIVASNEDIGLLGKEKAPSAMCYYFVPEYSE